MKQIEEAIQEMTKEEAKVMKYIGERAYDCVREETEDVECREHIETVLDMIITTAKDRVRDIAMDEIENS